MKTQLIILLFTFSMLQQDTYKIDFGATKKGNSWSVVNDGVMGGLSRGSMKLTENSILFRGDISLDNNGGFSSLRRSFSEFDISNFNDIQIRYRSTGISLALTFAVSRRWYVPNYKVSLDGTSSKWKTTTIKLTDFKKHYIGKAMNEQLEKEALKEIIRIGLITDEKKYGSFEFEVDYIKFK